MTRVWLVWDGEYSDKSVVGVYSSLELAQQACAINDIPLWRSDCWWIDRDDGYVVDQLAESVRTGLGQWNVTFDRDGNVLDAECLSLGTGEEPKGKAYEEVTSPTGYVFPYRLTVKLDAKGRDKAIKAASDYRRMYLALPDSEHKP